MADRQSVTVRFFAAARAAAGVDQEQIEVPESVTLAHVLNTAVGAHGSQLAQVLRRCSFLIDETAVHTDQVLVNPGSVIDVLPPFAGG